MEAVRISDEMDVVGKVPWRQTMQASVDEHSQLEVNVQTQLKYTCNLYFRILAIADGCDVFHL